MKVEGVLEYTMASYGKDAMSLTRTSLADHSASVANQRFGIQGSDGVWNTECETAIP